jgi:2-methylcitrate dehydratase PrpD
MNRRKFGQNALGALALAGAAQAQTQVAAKPAADATPAAAPVYKDVTRTLARYVIAAKYEDLPANVRKEAHRTLLNWTGVAIGGSRHETLDIAISALTPFAGQGQATVLGRKERLDVMHAALMNGISSHIFDYDDTHLRTIIHPAGPVASAILALSEYHPVSGKDFMNALVAGIEVECRIGNHVYPEHYDVGWHITGSTGVFGAAAAAGKILGLNEQQMLWALSLAATQPVGLKEMFGTMTKSFHPGRAAQNGLTAAFLAQKNYTSSDQPLEARAGWSNTLSTRHDYGEIVNNLGKTWEIALNTYKPFACGIVIHPTLDACIQLRNENKLKAEDIQNVDLTVNRLVLDLTGKKTPQTGLEGKFSIFYAAAVALIYGMAGEKQFSDKLAKDPTVIALRDKVTTTIDPNVSAERVKVVITLKDGRKLEKFITDAIGSVKNPMTDAMLEVKFADLADGVLPKAQARKIMDLAWAMDKQKNAADLAKASAA